MTSNPHAPVSKKNLAIIIGFVLSCFGLMLYLWIAFGGSVPLKSKGYQVKVPFREASQLAVEADVRISGVTVGKVKDIKSQPSGLSLATIELQSRYAPVPKDTRAMLRQKTLLGETYVELHPGPKTSGMLREGETLPVSQVANGVELDEVFRALDPKTRADFQTWLQTFASGLNGQGAGLNQAVGTLDPFSAEAQQFLQTLDTQHAALGRLLADGSVTLDALTERRGLLASTINNANRVFSVTARRQQELDELLQELPSFEREAKITVGRLRTFAQTTDPLVNELLPTTRKLQTTLTQLYAVSPDLAVLVRALRKLGPASRSGLPALAAALKTTQPFLRELDPTLRELNPMADFLGDYKDELVAFFANVTAATNAQVDKRHYLRVLTPLNPDLLAPYPRRLPLSRPNAYAKPGAFRNLLDGVEQFEVRQCGSKMPRLGDAVPGVLSQELRDQFFEFIFLGGKDPLPAPPCKKQDKYKIGERLTEFPQLTPAPSGPSR